MRGVEHQRHSKESALYRQQLEQYISTYLAQGYTPKELEEYLQGKGYDRHSIREALKHVNRTYHQNNLEIHKKPTHMNALALLIIGLIVLSIGVFFYVQNSPSYEFFITLETSVVQEQQPLEFIIATTKEVEVQVIVTSLDGQLLLQKNDVVSSSSSYFVFVDSIPSGSYTIDMYVTYKGDKVQHSFSFMIEESFETTPSTIEVSQETLDQLALAVSLQDSQTCAEITHSTYRDECYYVIARDTLNENLCSSISVLAKKDSCYLTQVLGGNALACTLINDPQMRSVCSTLE